MPKGDGKTSDRKGNTEASSRKKSTGPSIHPSHLSKILPFVSNPSLYQLALPSINGPSLYKPILSFINQPLPLSTEHPGSACSRPLALSLQNGPCRGYPDSSDGLGLVRHFPFSIRLALDHGQDRIAFKVLQSGRQ